MAKCKFCGEEVPQKELFKHFNEKHREEMAEVRRNAARVKKEGKGSKEQTKKEPASKKVTSPSLIEAAMLEFVGQTIVVPNTPALIYGYFCAKKYGFEGSVGEFLTEVIDDFYQARGINYYQEVQEGWQGIGKEISQEEQQDKELVATKA